MFLLLLMKQIIQGSFFSEAVRKYSLFRFETSTENTFRICWVFCIGFVVVVIVCFVLFVCFCFALALLLLLLLLFQSYVNGLKNLGP